MSIVKFNNGLKTLESETLRTIINFKNNILMLYFKDDSSARDAERLYKQAGCKTSHDDGVITLYNADQLNIEII